jgi:hypothetical protein
MADRLLIDGGFGRMKKQELVDLAAERGVDGSGTKDVIIARILEA